MSTTKDPAEAPEDLAELLVEMYASGAPHIAGYTPTSQRPRRAGDKPFEAIFVTGDGQVLEGIAHPDDRSNDPNYYSLRSEEGVEMAAGLLGVSLFYADDLDGQHAAVLLAIARSTERKAYLEREIARLVVVAQEADRIDDRLAILAEQLVAVEHAKYRMPINGNELRSRRAEIARAHRAKVSARNSANAAKRWARLSRVVKQERAS